MFIQKKNKQGNVSLHNIRKLIAMRLLTFFSFASHINLFLNWVRKSVLITAQQIRGGSEGI